MKTRGRYVLLALFFAGLVGLWVADQVHLPTRLDRERAKDRVLVALLDVRPDDLRKIEIEGGKRPIVLERREGDLWQMTAPLDVAADPSVVETLAFNLKSLARRPEAATLESKSDDFGLSPPSRTIRLWGTATDAPLAALEVGKISLDRRYVRVVGGTGVEVVNAQSLALVDLDPTRWRDRELFRVPSFEVDAVRLTGPGRNLALARKADGWRMTEPFRALAIEAKADGLIADLGTLKVTDDARFVLDDAQPADLARFGLEPPILTIEVDASRTDHRRPRQVLSVGKAVEGKPDLVYARRGDQNDVVIVEGRTLAGLGANPNVYRSPKVADIHPPRVDRIQVEADGKTFEVARQGLEWFITKPEVARADRQAVNGFLRSLDGLQTEIYLAFTTVPDSEVDRPQIVVKVWEATGARNATTPASTEADFTLKVGRRDATKKTLFGQVEGDSMVLGLPDSALEYLPRTVLQFRDHLVLALRIDRIERLTLGGSGKQIALNAPVLQLDPFKVGPIGWWMVEPTVAPTDPEAMGRLLKMLAGLRAETLVADPADDLAPYGLKDPSLTLTWSAFASDAPNPVGKSAGPNPPPPQLETFSMRIGKPVPSKPATRYAKLDDRPLVFTLPADAIAVLSGEFRDHHPLTLNASRVRSVHLDWRERSVTLAPRFDSARPTWAIQGPVIAPNIRPELTPSLIAAAADLTTARYLQYDGPLPTSTGLEPALLTIRFLVEGSTTPRVLKIGYPAFTGQVFASTAEGSSGPIFLVPEAPFLDWLKPPRQPGDLPDNVFEPDPIR